ncbi:TlpA disulfide reductase family protein [Flavobacterium cheniae]|jgi:peroxiredoxin|uniref:Peroxiredoxin n=1 Tax=Flavobacterium cheniae TaxID=295428 RepID=A0A562KSI8_9FLAO|nr:TlpA disulfide reductase family protein [Flavobacterium cheniae]TDR25412.1 peroxiredoxin [Flavobacterium cheniae]TWH98401.1 peroxiredoxin [Flavobacterium cheniae]
MKKIVFIITSALLFVACNNLKDNEFLISGTANGIENGKKVFIEVQTETGTLAKDTAVVTDGKFELKGITEEIDLGFIRIENEQINLPLILEEGKIEINIVKDSLHKSTLGGTPNNDKFQKFNTESRAISEKVAKFEKDNGPEMQKAQMSNDTVTINKLLKEYKKFQNEMNDYSKKFIKENPDAYLSVLLLENFLMRQYLTPEEIKSYFEGLDKDVKETKSGKKIKTALDSMSAIVIGKPAPNFSAPSPEGKTISLKESLGKVTIIDFWASWCGPCRAENPNVVALYNEFHPQGLNIIGVSLDKDAAKWKEAISKDGLIWPHVSNLKHWQEPIAKQYNVQSIPATFILDEKGNIVAKDLRGEELRAKVAALLGVK